MATTVTLTANGNDTKSFEHNGVKYDVVKDYEAGEVTYWVYKNESELEGDPRFDSLSAARKAIQADIDGKVTIAEKPIKIVPPMSQTGPKEEEEFSLTRIQPGEYRYEDNGNRYKVTQEAKTSPKTGLPSTWDFFWSVKKNGEEIAQSAVYAQAKMVVLRDTKRAQS